MLSSVTRLSADQYPFPLERLATYVFDLHIEALVPIRIQRLLDDARSLRLFSIGRRDRERVRESWCTPLAHARVPYPLLP